MPRVRRTLYRALIHLLALLSDLVGDDPVGKWVRRGLWRVAGAEIGRHTWLHGGTWITNPRLLRVGRNCFVNRNCYLDLEASITLGDGVVVGHGTTLVTADHAIGPPHARCGEITPLPIVIGDGAWLGANVTVLPGVTIGAGAVVGAGSLVIHDVAPNTVVVGSPAHQVRELPSDSAPGAPPPTPLRRVP